MATKSKLDTEYPLVLVEWVDIVNTTGEWQTAEQLLEWADQLESTVHHVGFVLKEDQDFVVLVDSYFPTTDPNNKHLSQMGTCTRIPRGCIVSIKYL